MNMRLFVTSFLTGSALLGLFGVSQGCGPSGGSYCEKVCDCQGCSQSARDACPTQVDDARKKAEDKGCAAEYDAAFACVASGQCVKDKLDTAGCESELAALTKCGVIGVGAKDACQSYTDDILAKYEECGIDVSNGSGGGTQPTCTDTLATESKCLDACLGVLDCPCAKDPSGSGCADKLKPYSDCVTPCLK